MLQSGCQTCIAETEFNPEPTDYPSFSGVLFPLVNVHLLLHSMSNAPLEVIIHVYHSQTEVIWTLMKLHSQVGILYKHVVFAQQWMGIKRWELYIRIPHSTVSA